MPIRFADMTLAAFAEALASERPAPGSGAAAAVTLASAAGCLAKAASVTLKRQESVELADLLGMAQALARSALAGADAESRAFRELLRDASEGAGETIEVGDGLLTLAEGVRALRRRLEPHVSPPLAGDLTAAEALLDAAERIVLANTAEAALAERRAGG